MANERPLGLRNDDKKVAENWNKIDWSKALKTEAQQAVIDAEIKKSEFPIMYLISTINGDVMLQKDWFARIIQDFWAFAKCKTDDDYINAFWKEFWPEADSSKSNWANLLYNDKLTNFSYFIYGWGSSCGLKFRPRS